MKHLGLWLGASALALNLGSAPAFADTTTNSVVVGSACNVMNYPTGQARADTQTAGGLKCVSATVSVGGFTPSASGSRMTPLSVTTSDSSGNLPTGAADIIFNTDATNPIYCNAVGATATVGDAKIPANSWLELTPAAGVTTLHCIATGGTVLANGLGGAGLATGSGGGGGGSGGGAVTQASGSVASGAYLAGAFANGSNVVEGTITTAHSCAVASYTIIGCLGAIDDAAALALPLEAQSAEPAAATTLNPVVAWADLYGKLVTSPYAPRNLFIHGAANTTGATATTLNAAAGAGVKNYVTDLTCTRSDAGTTSITVTFSDSATTVVDIPDNGGGGGWSHAFNVPLATAANTAFTFTVGGGGVTTMHCSDSGYTGA